MKRFIKKILTKIFTALALRNVASHGEGTHVNFPCKFTRRTVIGNNCHFNGMEISGEGNVRIGDNFHSGKKIRLLTSYHNYDSGTSIPYDDTYVTRDIIIEDNVWLGEGVIILAGAHIGEGAIIQAGSVVVGKIPPCAVAGGHPAKPYKYRNVDHYETLKAQKKFY